MWSLLVRKPRPGSSAIQLTSNRSPNWANIAHLSVRSSVESFHVNSRYILEAKLKLLQKHSKIRLSQKINWISFQCKVFTSSMWHRRRRKPRQDEIFLLWLCFTNDIIICTAALLPRMYHWWMHPVKVLKYDNKRIIKGVNSRRKVYSW